MNALDLDPDIEHALTETRADRLWCDLETKVRAALWASARGYRLSTSRYQCAHGLARQGRTDFCCAAHSKILDHATLWLEDRVPVVLVTQPYLAEEQAIELGGVYAELHDLDLMVGDPENGWYQHGTLPLRFARRTVVDRVDGDVVDAVVDGIDLVETSTGRRVVWSFTVPGGRRVEGTTSSRLTTHPDCRMARWAEAVLGFPMVEGYKLDTMILLGRACSVVLGQHDQPRPGQARDYVAAVLPVA